MHRLRIKALADFGMAEHVCSALKICNRQTLPCFCRSHSLRPNQNVCGYAIPRRWTTRLRHQLCDCCGLSRAHCHTGVAPEDQGGPRDLLHCDHTPSIQGRDGTWEEGVSKGDWMLVADASDCVMDVHPVSTFIQSLLDKAVSRASAPICCC